MIGDPLPAAIALFQVILIDIALAGDNVIVIGIAAAGLDRAERSRAIAIGIAAATVLRIVFALLASYLLAIIGLLLAGGLLLLWVCWKMWRELRQNSAAEAAGHNAGHDAPLESAAQRKTLRQAVWQIVLADVSMSLDNVLAVSGAAREHPAVLVFGLLISVLLMGLAASFVARLLGRHRWIAYLGLAIIVAVALNMIYHGAMETRPILNWIGTALHGTTATGPG